MMKPWLNIRGFCHISSKFQCISSVYKLDCKDEFSIQNLQGFPGGASGKESDCQCRRLKTHGFHPFSRRFLGLGIQVLAEFSFEFKTRTQVAQLVKNPSAMQKTQEMQVRSLGQEDPLKEGMATHSTILAQGIPWTEEPGGL